MSRECELKLLKNLNLLMLSTSEVYPERCVFSLYHGLAICRPLKISLKWPVGVQRGGIF